MAIDISVKSPFACMSHTSGTSAAVETDGEITTYIYRPRTASVLVGQENSTCVRSNFM